MILNLCEKGRNLYKHRLYSKEANNVSTIIKLAGKEAIRNYTTAYSTDVGLHYEYCKTVL